MKQALHIFRKDVRRLWPLIAVVLVFFGSGLAAWIPGLNRDMGFDVVDGAIATNAQPFVWAFQILLIPSCWILAALVVHQEALPDEQQFWLTRPYDRMSLLGAKVLFLSVFMLLPQLVVGCMSEVSNGVPILPHIAGLLAWGITSSAWLILPGIAIAVVTSSLTGFVSAILGLSAAVGVYAFCGMTNHHWYAPSVLAPGITNLAGYIPMILLAICAVVLQYKRRKTGWSRVLLAAGLLAPAVTLPADGLVSLSTRLQNPGFDPSRVHIAFDESAPPRFEGKQFNDRTCESLRLNVEGLPNGATLESFGYPSLEIEPWKVGGRIALSENQAAIEQFSDGFREMLCLDDSTYEALRNQSLTLRLSISATVRSTVDEVRVPLVKGTVGNVGACGLDWELDGIRCHLAMPAFDALNAGYELSGRKAYSTTFTSNEYSFPGSSSAPVRDVLFTFAPQGMIPVTQRPDIWDQGATLILRTQRAIGYIERDLVYHNLRLADKAEPQ